MSKKDKKKPPKKTKVPKPTHPPINVHSTRPMVLAKPPINIAAWSRELDEYKEVLFGRVEPPIKLGRITLMEVADAYFSRASEMTMQIQKLERQGQVKTGEPIYKFRTGELRTFLEMCKRAGDLGSRRITYDSAIAEAARTGRAKHADDQEMD